MRANLDIDIMRAKNGKILIIDLSDNSVLDQYTDEEANQLVQEMEPLIVKIKEFLNAG